MLLALATEPTWGCGTDVTGHDMPMVTEKRISRRAEERAERRKYDESLKSRKKRRVGGRATVSWKVKWSPLS